MQKEKNLDAPMHAVVKITATTCRRCRDCIAICPEEALSWTQGRVVVDEAKCTGCGRCVQVCRINILKIVSDTA